jgi:hypothetical protein
MNYRAFCILLGIAWLLAYCGSELGSVPPPNYKNRAKVVTVVVAQATTWAVSNNSSTSSNSTQSNKSQSINVKAELWADNWFALYLDDQLIKEDSVPITTERSFNAESVTFPATYPMHFNVILKDYIKNDTGLEYIGTNRQQIGDDGFIGQFTDANPVAGQGDCGFTSIPEPTDWKSPTFDTNSWLVASLYSATQVKGYDTIAWKPEA